MSSGALDRQFGCVAIGGRGLLIDGPPVSGKSALALALIDRGAQLVGDDGVNLRRAEGGVWAAPPPHTTGLLEIRNLGLTRFDPVEAPVCLLLRLDRAAPRFIEQAGTVTLLDQAIPALELYPDAATLPLRAEHALRLFGLPA